MKTARLLFWSAVLYSILLILLRGAFPSESSPTVFLLGLPLIVIALVIARDLIGRSTVPLPTASYHPVSNPRHDLVNFLAGQIRVAARASDSYFENVLRSRLKDLLVSKVSLETGLDAEVARRVLSDPIEGPKLLHAEELYSTLYGSVPKMGVERLRMIKQAIEMIGEWKEWT